LFLGLDNAGKTTLLHMLRDDKVKHRDSGESAQRRRAVGYASLHCRSCHSRVCVVAPCLPFSPLFQIIAHEPTRHPQNEELVIGNVRSDRGASTQHAAQRIIE